MAVSAATRIAVFVGGLAVLFGVAFVLGGAVDPDGAGEGTGDHANPPTDGGSAHAGEGVHASGGASTDVGAPARLVVEDGRFEPGRVERLRFEVVDRSGRTVEDFDVEHGRAMHAIAVRHDLTGYRHVHPRRIGDGGWAVDVAFPDAGPHRVFADFASGGRSYTLSADVRVAGDYSAQELPAPAKAAAAGDGYRVELARHGRERRFSVTRDGEAVTDVEPYLGARGHLVALREGDLAFQHVHPQDEATAGRDVTFAVSFARPGRYRLFLQFQHDGEVRTAAFTERVGDDSGHAHGEAGHGH